MILCFFQQIKFDEADYWLDMKKRAPPEAVPMIDKLVTKEKIPDIGIVGHPRRYFSKTEILKAVGYLSVDK